jgi:PAS domain S-box-containing protein
MIDDRAFFRSLVEKGSDAIVSIDEDSTIVFANESVERVFGYDPDELVGEPLTTVMPDAFHGDHHAAIDRYLDTGDRTFDWTDIRLPGRHRDGHEVPLSITFEEHVHDDRRLFSGIMRDISEQQAYERTLETLAEVARALMCTRTPAEIGDRVVAAVEESLEFPLGALYALDATERRLYPIAHTESVTELLGQPPTLGPDSLTWAAFEAGEIRQYHDALDDRAVDGEPLLVGSLLVVPLGDRGCLLIGDVDERTFADREIRLAGILGANTAAALNRADREGELERQNDRLERFASFLSHDLRDPLNAARAQLALVRAEFEGDEALLDDLETVHDRMGALIEDTLTLTKQGRTIGETERIELDRAAEDAWATAAGDAPDATLRIADEPGTIEADPGRLRTLFENLLGNAVHHAAPDVTVRVGRLSDAAGFYVEDDGPGIPPGERDRVFETGYTGGDGTGLGLSIVREVAEAHGWHVAVTDGDDGGARFEVRFTRRARTANPE